MDSDDMKRIKAVPQKEALHRMLKRNTRAEKDVADAVRVAPQTLWGWADVSVDSHLPGARIPALLMASDDTSLLEYWAGLQGMNVVSVPRAVGATDSSQLAELARAFAAFLDHHVDAESDGKWTPIEVDVLRPIAMELSARAQAHLAWAERQSKVEPITERRRA